MGIPWFKAVGANSFAKNIPDDKNASVESAYRE
jgi:hypothetical protein